MYCKSKNYTYVYRQAAAQMPAAAPAPMPTNVQAPAPSQAALATAMQETTPHHILFLTNLPEETNEMMLSMLFNQYDHFKFLFLNLFWQRTAYLITIKSTESFFRVRINMCVDAWQAF